MVSPVEGAGETIRRVRISTIKDGAAAGLQVGGAHRDRLGQREDRRVTYSAERHTLSNMNPQLPGRAKAKEIGRNAVEQPSCRGAARTR